MRHSKQKRKMCVCAKTKRRGEAGGQDAGRRVLKELPREGLYALLCYLDFIWVEIESHRRIFSWVMNDYFIGTVEMIMERVTLYGTFVGISRLHVSSRQLNGHSLVFVLYQIKCVQNMCTCMYKYLTYSQVVVNMLFTSYLQVVVHIHIDNISIHSI